MKIKMTLALFLLLVANSSYAKNGVSCKSFGTQAAAQQYYDAKKPGWKKLDLDGDGEPCECLPGGSNYNESVCRSWRKKNKK